MNRVVIVEDHQSFRESLINVLFDYEIVGIAKDGLAAIDIIAKTRPDLLLLDLSIPKMNGLQLLHKIKPLYPDLKIVVLTIHDSPEYCRECVDAGVNAYVLKDEGRKKLREVIHRVLAGEKYCKHPV